MTSKLVRQVQSLQQLEHAWRAIQENARTSRSQEVRQEIDEFSKEAGHRIRSLCNRLSRGRFQFAPAKGIPLPKIGIDAKQDKAKFRPIVLAPIESRIVQRSILETLIAHPGMQNYVNTPHSFGGVRKLNGAKTAAVPAAISSVLQAMGDGGSFVILADVQGFFTKISKCNVGNIISDVIRDNEFMALFDRAIKVELSNLIELKEKAAAFPIEDIGVAQGNSLSPLLGNIILFQFDQVMNEGDCRCIRYIDDFIVLAPTKKAARARLQKAVQLLAKLGMELSPEKSSKEPIPIGEAFHFLGIELNNGLIRPTPKAIQRFLKFIDNETKTSIFSLRDCLRGQVLDKSFSVISTLKRLDGIIRGWGTHYRFCNDPVLWVQLDHQIKKRIRAYLGVYADIRSKLPEGLGSQLLGIQELSMIDNRALIWPKIKLNTGLRAKYGSNKISAA